MVSWQWQLLMNAFKSVMLGYKRGRAIAQAVSRRLPTEAARLQAQVRSCGVCGGQSGFSFPCQSSFHRLLHTHHHLSSGAGTVGQLVGDVPSGMSQPTPRNLLSYMSGDLRASYPMETGVIL
jgi:hypothetical protein